MDLLERLEEYAASGACAMHMPGHKRAEELLGGPLPWRLDITEIDGFDNLHGAEGILKEGMERAARLYGSPRAFYLVNGSTCGILAGICAATRPGDTVLLVRGCHKSIYHGLELRALVPVYLDVPADPATGITASVPPELVEEALEQHPEIRLLILTSPTFEGVISDLPRLVEIAHRRGVPVLVDQAHGAHLDLSPWFTGGALAAGADLVIQSLHKTLPSLTQTALAHCQGELVSAEEMARQLSIFESSSPSYLLMGSIDRCIGLMERDGSALLEAHFRRLKKFEGKIAGLQHLQVFCYGADRLAHHPGFFAFDRSKLVISTRGTDLTGPRLMDRLRREDRIELEMALGDYAVAMTSICTSDEELDRLASALCRIDETLSPAPEIPPAKVPPLPPRVLSVGEARIRPAVCIPLEEAEGRISGEMVWAYPPGVPLVVPGEVFTGSLIAAFRDLSARDVRLHGERGDPPCTVWVLAEGKVSEEARPS